MDNNNLEFISAQGISDLSSHELFKINYEKPSLTFNNYLSDCEDEIMQIINDKGDSSRFVNFIANMNSGKTYSLLDIGYRRKLKMIILEPLQIIALQKFNEYRKNYPKRRQLGLVHGQLNETAKESKVTVNKISEMLNSNNKVYLCVYDSLKKFFNDGLSNLFEPSDYILVIDEVHNLITEYQYRSEIVHFISDVKPLFKKVIHLTGTPEAVINNDYKSYFFQRNTPDHISKKTIKIVRYEGDNRYRLLNLLLNDKSKGLKVILIDDKEKMKKLAYALIKKLGDGRKVRILSSALKDTDEYINLMEREEIDSSVEFLFTTRVISDGANIKTNVASVYLVDLNNNYWVKRQFLSRFRNSIDNIYELRKNATEREIDFNSLSNYLDEKVKVLKEKIPHIEKEVSIQKSIDRNYSTKEYFKSNNDKEKHLYYSELYDSVVISQESIRNTLINILNSRLENSIQYTKQFYLELAGYKVEIINYEDLVSNEISESEFKELIGDVQISKISEDSSILRSYFRELFTSYCAKLDASKLMNQHVLDAVDTSLLTNKSELNKLSYCFIDKKSFSYMVDAYELVVSGYPINVIIDLLILKSEGLRQYNSLIRKLNFHSGFRIASKLGEHVYKLKHNAIVEDFYFPYVFQQYFANKRRLTKEDISNGRILWSAYLDSQGRGDRFVECLDAVFKFSRIRNSRMDDYEISGSQSLTSLLLSSEIKVLGSDQRKLAFVPYIRLIRKLDAVITTRALLESDPLLSLRDYVLEMLKIEQSRRSNRGFENFKESGVSSERFSDNRRCEVLVMNGKDLILRELPAPEEP